MAVAPSSYDDLFSASDERTVVDKRTVPITKLVSFKDHPFRVRDDADMTKLIDSIKINGVLEPIVVRPAGREYEIISGHRRVHACLYAGVTEVDVIVRNLTDAEAIVAMVDSNLKREKVLPSELAKAYKMQMEAIKELPENHNKAVEKMIEMAQSSKTVIYRYIRLTELVPELLEMVDEKRINVKAGAELASLDIESQNVISGYMVENEKVKLPLAKAKQLVIYASAGLSQDVLDEVLLKKEKEATTKQYTLPVAIVQMFPEGTSQTEMEKQIIEALSAGQRLSRY